MREHWGDSADEALSCVEATLDEWWGGGAREMTADSRQHVMTAVYFVQRRMTEIRAERDELRPEVERLRGELERLRDDLQAAREAAAHMWHASEHGLAVEEVATWYAWLPPLLDERARARVEQYAHVRAQLRVERDEARELVRVAMESGAQDFSPARERHPWAYPHLPESEQQ